MDFLLTIKLENISDKKERLLIVVRLLTNDFTENTNQVDYNKKFLNKIVITESSKVYLVKEVAEINKNKVFQPYKDLCSRIAAIISEYNSTYKYPRSLSTTLIETSHHQQFFSVNLPKLTDIDSQINPEFTSHFMEDFLFKVLD